MADSSSNSDDIVSARKIKELEPIHNAWNEWTRTKQVRSPYPEREPPLITVKNTVAT
jgi:hypothetical protein